MLDVVVVGGGPAGSYTAYQLAKSGLTVLVLEDHKTIGKPRFCTGVIGKEAFNRFDLPHKSIQREIKKAKFYSPLGSILEISRDKTEAYVVDRTIFDQGIAHKAMDEGASYLLSTRCYDIDIKKDYVRVKIETRGESFIFKARVCVLAAGINYRFHEKLGIGKPVNFLDCAQTELPARDFFSMEIYLGNEIAPESFAWAVPVSSDLVRVGVSTTKKNSLHLIEKLLKKDFIRTRIDRIDKKDIHIKRKVIPYGIAKKSYGDRLIVVGDSASQTKSTTGGGILNGLICSSIAAETIISAFEKGGFDHKNLKSYESRWKRQIGHDMRMGLYARKIFKQFADSHIESLVRLCNINEMHSILKKFADFDRHSCFLVEFMKQPIFWKYLLFNASGLKSWSIHERL